MSTSDRPATLCEAFQRTAAIDPDAVALRTPGDTQTLTWREYADQVRQVAAGLAGLGVRRGDTVSLMMANRVEFYPLEVGAQHVGAISFSVYNTLPGGAVGVPVRQRRHQGGDVRGAVRRPDPCQRGRHRAHRLPRRVARRHLVRRRPHRRRCRRLRLRVRLAGSAIRRRRHAYLHLGHHRQPQGCGDDARQPAVPGVRGGRSPRRPVRRSQHVVPADGTHRRPDGRAVSTGGVRDPDHHRLRPESDCGRTAGRAADDLGCRAPGLGEAQGRNRIRGGKRTGRD